MPPRQQRKGGWVGDNLGGQNSYEARHGTAKAWRTVPVFVNAERLPQCKRKYLSRKPCWCRATCGAVTYLRRVMSAGKPTLVVRDIQNKINGSTGLPTERFPSK